MKQGAEEGPGAAFVGRKAYILTYPVVLLAAELNSLSSFEYNVQTMDHAALHK